MIENTPLTPCNEVFLDYEQRVGMVKWFANHHEIGEFTIWHEGDKISITFSDPMDATLFRLTYVYD